MGHQLQNLGLYGHIQCSSSAIRSSGLQHMAMAIITSGAYRLRAHGDTVSACAPGWEGPLLSITRAFSLLLPGKLLVAHQGTANLFPYCKQGIQTGHDPGIAISCQSGYPVSSSFPGRLLSKSSPSKSRASACREALSSSPIIDSMVTLSAAGFPTIQALSFPWKVMPHGPHAACVCGKTGAQVLHSNA